MSQATSKNNQHEGSLLRNKVDPSGSNNDPIAVAVPVALPTNDDYIYPPLANSHGNPTIVPVAVPILPPSTTREFFSINSKQKLTLQRQGFTGGLCQTLEKCNQIFPLRIWIVDNSGSMQLPDGHRLVETAAQRDFQCVSCSRWDEIRECIKYHAQMSSLLEAPTQFRLLNHPQIRSSKGEGLDSQHMSIAENGSSRISSELQHVMDVMNQSSPVGVTPLTRHIHEVRDTVQRMAPMLRENGQRVAIVIATDGLPSDKRGRSHSYERQKFVEALRSLEGLPVWVVIRLCTDEDKVVEFYSELDGQLELSVEVLDDFLGEAGELYEQNPWLNYTLPIHRLRELGFHHRLIDLIDERPLTRSEVRDYCTFLFGSDKMDGVADPEANWDGFVRDLDRLIKEEALQWDPIKRRMAPVINLKKLKTVYGNKKRLRKVFQRK